jgi:nucleotide-binding universal stress UspA family protein
VGAIVVGVDGSAGAREALRFAAAEARLREVPLRVLHAWRPALIDAAPEPWAVPFARPPLNVDLLEIERARADSVLAHALEEVEADGVPVEGELVEGAAVPALLGAAEGAELLVVGSRGLGGFRSLLLGSVGQQCADHAPCPVVIVRGTDGRG